MAGFMIRFLISNLFLSGIIIILLVIRHISARILTVRMQYNLWLLLLVLLTVPFIPLRPIGFSQAFAWLSSLGNSFPSDITSVIDNAAKINAYRQPPLLTGIQDLAVSVSGGTPAVIGFILFIIWVAGILVMAVPDIKALARLNALKKSALPLQNDEIRTLYGCCLEEMKITADIPIYSTAFLQSPILAGLFKPCIYLPIRLLSDFHTKELRYMLLHELQHYKSKDNLAGCLACPAAILYWFNPFVRLALDKMHGDKEAA